jgi:hypothetical protein
MANAQEGNRSSAPNPEQMAGMNAMVSAAVKEAVAAVFAGLTPTLEGMALTPEKIRAITAPHVDEAKVAREKRERAQWKQDEDERLKQDQERQNRCTHLDKRGQTSVRLIRNYPDRQARGICVLCQALIYPKSWFVLAPDAEHPRGKPVLMGPHKDYAIVQQIIAYEGS